MADRRYPADREAGSCAHEIGICAPDGLTGVFGNLFFVHAICPAGQHEDRFAACLSSKYKRLHDLPELAAGARSSFLRSARGFDMLDHGIRITKGLDQILYLLRRG